MDFTATERQRRKAERDRAEGWVRITVRVAAEHADAVRAYAASMPPPEPRSIPGQTTIDDVLNGVSAHENQDG